MSIEDLKIESEQFIEYVNLAYDVALNLQKHISIEMQKISEKNEEYYNLEWKHSYLSQYIRLLEDIVEEAENTIYFENTEMHEVQNNIMILPLYPDEDMYVCSDESIEYFWRRVRMRKITD